MTTKICSKPNCKHKGTPQDISCFQENDKCKDGHVGTCNDCKEDQRQARKLAKESGTLGQRSVSRRKTNDLPLPPPKGDKGKALKNKITKVAINTKGSPVADVVSSPVIDMTGNNEIYRTAAAIFVRSIERKFMESVAAELKD